ncbi:glycosyltransferase [Sulfitobacter sp. D35]|uniref:glycosyltransferase family protein n=1 Tax=Sulfitobacter sp. D35 TaxID=3083252 RepID=UPI00296EB8B1|nr:glycosyltransferase [Sulfitobacter sp. D35]MDW4499710.1 glycosyltransferase [Sulfitobacter sp. D35]
MTAPGPRVMIVVTHLLGTGHLARAATLARAFVAAGAEVTLVSGGFAVPRIDTGGADLVQLPPLRSDGVDFSRLLDGNDNPADDALFRSRADQMIDTLRRTDPQVLITELFPFGRRNLRQEFTALLEAADDLEARPLILCSIRDILAPPSKPSRADWTEALVARHYDAVLVHSDPTVTPLELSWPVTDALAAKLAYTGFVAPPPAPLHPTTDGAGEVLISAGGGSVGDHVYSAALAAARLQPTRNWRLLVGGADAHDRCASLRAEAPSNVIVEPARADFRQMLHHAAASVSMCGYNTALDLLQAGTPAVIVPFDAGSEVEQGLRAKALSRLPGFETIRATDLDAKGLANAVMRLESGPRRTPVTTGLDGARHSAEIVFEMLEDR